MFKEHITTIFITVAIVFISLFLSKLDTFVVAQNYLSDLHIKYLSSKENHDKNIKIILIDQSSLNWANENFSISWPWPREIYANVISFLQHSKANTIDIIFSEPSIYGESDDIIFSNALKLSNNIGTVTLSNNDGRYNHIPKHIKESLYIDGSLKNKKYASFATKNLTESFSISGLVSALPDSDGKIRRIELFDSFDNKIVPTLSLATYLTINHKNYTVDNNLLYLDNNIFNKNAIINYHGASQTYKTFNIASIIESQININNNEKPTIDPKLFENSYVFIGVSAPGLMDLKSTPTDAIYPGVEIHATILDNIINNNFLKNPSLYKVAIFTSIAIFFILLLYQISNSIYVPIIFTIIIIVIAISLSIYLYFLNLLLQLFFILFTITTASTIGFIINYLKESEQKRFIKNAFAHYVSPSVIDELIRDNKTPELGGKKEKLTIFFSDIEGFTTISTKLEPQILSKMLNEYLEIVGDIILKHNGTIDKYIGDAIVAFWNAPKEQINHAELALKATLEIGQELIAKNSYFLKKYNAVLNTRIGIHTGEVIIGNMGTPKRFNYTFIGDAGNLAARLESANKQFGTYVMISQDTKNDIDDVCDYYRYPNSFFFRYLGEIRVIGRDSGVKIYEPMSEKLHFLDDFNSAIEALYRGELDKAHTALSNLADIDSVSKKYLSIIEKIKNNQAKLIDGVLYLDEK